ncbi:universal stress protein [Methanocella sp. CWC-04]|uniref:Universal stress protein n=1 Tax=Methanooceanicella nereidis TaxID=2052831 RepID=A0AAP2RC95_9EURY|nr:universal stress protein [Methanocella sp. CWC-04]
MLLNILLATDGKPHSEKAMNYAIEYAMLHKAMLFIVFVVSPKTGEDKETIITYGKGVLEEVKMKAMEHGVSVTTLLEAGSPYESILKAADRISAEAIIVGTSGKTVIDRVLIGSVSEYVVRNACCTVVVVR